MLFIARNLRNTNPSLVRFGSSIKVILLENMDNRGKSGDLISVKRGFARNFLIPRKFAAYATPANKEKYASLSRSNDYKN